MAGYSIILFLAALGIATGAFNKTETYGSQLAVSEITELFIHSELQGDIKWHSNDEESVQFVITKFGETYSDFDNIIVDFQDGGHRVSLKLSLQLAATPSAASKQAAANSFTLLLGILLTGIILHQLNNARPTLLLMFVIFLCCGILYVFAQTSPSARANVDIFVPRNFSFKSISLVSIQGTIQVDNDLIALTDSSSLHCASGDMSKACPSCCSANGKCVSGSCQCDVGHRNGTADCAEQTETTLNLYVNPNDPIIVAANTPEGDQILMIGEKDSNGDVTEIQSFRVVDSEGNTTYTELSENNTITSAKHSSGMTMDFNWDVDSNYTMVQVTIVLPDTSQQVTINIDLTDNSIDNDTLDFDDTLDKRSINDDYNNIKNKRIKSNKKTDNNMNDIPVLRTYESKRSKRNAQPSNTARVSVEVISCGLPEDDAIVQADVSQDGNTNQYSGKHSDTLGLYYIDIPTKVAVAEVTENVCDAIEMALDKACSWYDELGKIIKTFSKHSLEKLLCFYLGKGLQLIPQLRLIPIYRFCKTVFKGVDYYCNKINAPVINVPGVDVPKKSELICDLVTEFTDTAIDTFRDADVHFTPFAIFPGGYTITATGQGLTLQPGTSVVPTTFTITDDSAFQITTLSVSPADPGPGENYVVNVQYKCYTSLTYVTMEIVGTDGYSDVATCYGGPYCVLHVPGAAELVQDVITVTISDTSHGQTLSRQAIIIF